ncbi:MAG: putative Zn-dependent peptidase [Candidatus Paceibacteria bacterium]|jgi:predicted Zn-dependent peptidase
MGEECGVRMPYALKMGTELRETSCQLRSGRLWMRALLGSALLAAGSAALAQSPPSLQPAERALEHELENGWRFLIYPRHEAPTVSFETYVPVGAANDPAGMSGLSNLVKNLMFKGSSRIGTKNWGEEEPTLTAADEAHERWLSSQESGSPEEQSAALIAFDRACERAALWVDPEEFSRVLERAGSDTSLNAYSDQDSTRFVVSLPSNQTELWCWMEAERFRDPIFREFYVERAALLEDWQARASADPDELLGEKLRGAAYGDHPLGRASIGNFNEIGRLRREDAKLFFRAHYGPQQLVTVIAGDVDPDRLIPLLDRYFGQVPASEQSTFSLPLIPKQTEERRIEVPFDGQPRLRIAWHVPPLAHPDSAALEITIRLLGYARSSRLEKRLKRSSGMLSELVITHAWDGNRLQSLAQIRCTPTLNTTTKEIELAIYNEMDKLAKNGPEAEELAGVKRVATADFYRSLRRNEALTKGLASAWIMTGHWRHFFEWEQRLSAVQPREVQAVLRKWFLPANRTVATLVSLEASPVGGQEQAK